MSEDEKKVQETKECCCCKCWKTIFIAIALLAIGFAFGHCGAMRRHGCYMKGPCRLGWDGPPKACWMDKDSTDKKVFGEKKGWLGHKEGCMCPKCVKKAGGPADPNKTGCPMAGKDMGKDKE